MELQQLLEEMIKEGIVKGTLSQPKYKTYSYHKTFIHLIEESKCYYQFEAFTKEQAFHTNVSREKLLEYLMEVYVNYKQLHIITRENERMIRVSNKGKLHVTIRALMAPVKAKTHNTQKQHILPEGEPVDFLIHLGIMDIEGNVKHKWYDKFKQINRYLELIEDSLKHLDTLEPTIVDFGCGKSYLTFALYYYLVKVRKLNVTIIGLDLKEKVIQNLQELTKELGYGGLEFRVGDIALFDYDKPIDMVISLHACNLATDYALEKAVKWQAKVIMAVPCCHKELNGQIDVKALEAVFNYGVLKERISALMTDGLRAELLKAMGYEVQILEFVDMEHTPKNLMIRGYLTGERQAEPGIAYKETCEQFSVRPALEKLLFHS